MASQEASPEGIALRHRARAPEQEPRLCSRIARAASYGGRKLGSRRRAAWNCSIARPLSFCVIQSSPN